MWNNWVEKAKQAAANLDQQLNESVGVESAVPKPAVTTTGTDTGANVWNDDDFKFDDDDEEEDQQQQQPEATAAPIAATETPTVDFPATPQPKEAPATPASATPTTEEATSDEKVVDNDSAKEATADNSNAWAADEDENPDFDDFDGVSPPTAAEGTEQKPPDSPQNRLASALNVNLSGLGKNSPKSGIAGALTTNLGGLGQKLAAAGNESSIAGALSTNLGGLGQKLKMPAAGNEINFMSPLSSLMTSISHDQDQQENQEKQEQQLPPVETPMKEPEPTINTIEDADPSVSNGAWQEDDIDLGDDDEPSEKVAAGTAPTIDVQPEEKKAEEKEEKQPDEPTETATTAPPAETQAASPAEVEPQQSKEEKSQQPAATEATSGTSTPPTATAPPPEAGPTVSSAELEQVKKLLSQREEQLAAKAEQMFQLQQMYEKEKQDLVKKVADTKDEAKKRILKARERCEATEAKLQASTAALTEDASQQAQLVAALRQEGEKLAQKQSEMEKTVRSARGEARELQEKLEDETEAKVTALAKIEKLEAELKTTKDQLSSARMGETQAGKLDTELQSAKEELSNKSNTIMSLEATVKELKTERKALMEEVEASRIGAEEENLREAKKIRKEHNATVTDLEAKLQMSEKEAAVREDSLRREVEELRKRWQDAVRRTDALSMDVQSSTAPLLRQLESMERQHRARASAAAELETKLRAELEETVIRNEKLTKEHSELKTKYGRLERKSKEQEEDLTDRQKTIDELTAKIKRLEEKLQDLQVEGEKRQEEYEKVERLANEGVSKVRSEMSQAVLESEERYRSQLDSMKEELRIEQDKRSQLEKQVDELLENAAVIIPTASNDYVMKESKPKNLKQSEGQAAILQGALHGLGGLSSDDEDFDEDEELAAPKLQHQSSTASSYAALEQLTQNLKSAKKELETLRKRLAESEKTRESLVEELGESREAKEKLPLFEAKVKELMADNREKELEIQGLQDDIAEVKEMYRAQLNILLEEKAALAAAAAAENGKKEMNGNSNDPASQPELVEDALGIA